MRSYRLPDIVRLWEDGDGNLLGWCMIYPRWNSFEALLHPDHRDGKLANGILDWAERETWAWMQKEGRSGKPLELDIFEGDLSRIRLLEQRGYVRAYATHVVGLRSLDTPISDALLPEGFTIRTIQGTHEADKVVAVVNAAFGWSWTADDFRHFMESPGFNDESRVVVAPDGRFATFCYLMFDDVNRLGMFEDVCTHPDFQRMGLAKALLTVGMQRMREKGMHTALVAYEADSGSLSRFYESLGFEPKYRLYNYIKSF